MPDFLQGLNCAWFTVPVILATIGIFAAVKWLDWREKGSRFLMWLVMDSGIKLGRLAPWVFGLALGGRRPHKKEEGGSKHGPQS